MQLFVGVKRDTSIVHHGFVLYGEDGCVIAKQQKKSTVHELAYMDYILAIHWAIRKTHQLGLRQAFPPEETIHLIFSSKNVGTWFEKEEAPEPYSVEFADLLFDMAFIANPVRPLVSQTVDTKVFQGKKEEEPLQKATDLFSSYLN